ncbi:hypothetical protein FJTKL_00942 [Diaporthe vaccinii]|uniref:Uncharacterized protein n=1 Tax=Diaporthe vaccinii TaxID=105482 RepID=A0ABR4E1Q4_9PEZI
MKSSIIFRPQSSRCITSITSQIAPVPSTPCGRVYKMCAKRAKQSFYAAQTARGIRSRVVPYRVPKNGR